MLFEIDDIFCIFESRLISLDEYFIVDLKNSFNNVSIENLQDFDFSETLYNMENGYIVVYDFDEEDFQIGFFLVFLVFFIEDVNQCYFII